MVLYHTVKICIERFDFLVKKSLIWVSFGFLSFQAAPNRCDSPVTILNKTPCTSCAAAAAVVCPRGFRKITKSPEFCRCVIIQPFPFRSLSMYVSNVLLSCFSYVVEIGDRQVEQQGCAHTCQGVTTVQQCCPGFWGPLCLRELQWPQKTLKIHKKIHECHCFMWNIQVYVIYTVDKSLHFLGPPFISFSWTILVKYSDIT